MTQLALLFTINLKKILYNFQWFNRDLTLHANQKFWFKMRFRNFHQEKKKSQNSNRFSWERTPPCPWNYSRERAKCTHDKKQTRHEKMAAGKPNPSLRQRRRRIAAAHSHVILHLDQSIYKREEKKTFLPFFLREFVSWLKRNARRPSRAIRPSVRVWSVTTVTTTTTKPRIERKKKKWCRDAAVWFDIRQHPSCLHYAQRTNGQGGDDDDEEEERRRMQSNEDNKKDKQSLG